MLIRSMISIALRMGLVLGGSVLLLSVLHHTLTVQNDRFEFYALAVALVFMGAGVALGRKVPALRRRVAAQSSNSLLSSRELDVLSLLSEGLSNQEIADRLFVSTNTVKTHLANIYSKMNVRRRTEAVKRANDLGMLTNHPIG